MMPEHGLFHAFSDADGKYLPIGCFHAQPPVDAATGERYHETLCPQRVRFSLKNTVDKGGPQGVISPGRLGMAPAGGKGTVRSRRGNERGKGSAMNAWKLAPLVFIVLGILDIIYGLLMDDRISLLMGPALIVIAVYIMARERKRSAGGR